MLPSAPELNLQDYKAAVFRHATPRHRGKDSGGLLAESGFSLRQIRERLQDEEIFVSKTSIHLLLKKYKAKGTVQDLRWYRLPTMFLRLHYRLIDAELATNADLTSRQLQQRIEEKFPSLNPSISTVQRARCRLGWVCKKTR